MKLKFSALALMLWLSFSIASCSSENNSDPVDPCSQTTCINGGTCIDGSCQCPEGYYGANCELQKTPESVRITNIVVREFNNFDPNGNAWDTSISGPLPDIYVSLYKSNGAG